MKIEKRGQVTTFIILGIVIVVIVGIVLYVQKNIFLGPATPENLQRELVSIKEQIEKCIQKESPNYIEKIGLQGGYLTTPEDTYRLYEGNTVSYLCYNQANTEKCMNRMLTLTEMEKSLNENIKFGLNKCISLSSFKKINYELKAEHAPIVKTSIGKDNILITVNYPIKLSKAGVEVSVSDFSKTINTPLGELYDVANDILDVETEFGEFDQLIYMLEKRGQYIIKKDRPYPDKLYILQKKDNPYVFQFFVEGEPS